MVSLISLSFLALQLCLATALNLHDLVKLPAHEASQVRAPIKKLVQHDKLKHLAAHDVAHAKALIHRARSGAAKFSGDSQVIGVEIANLVTTYIAAIDIGSPPTTYNVIVDSGSSNTWVGANTPFTSTSTTQNLNAGVAVSYGSGFFSGFEVLDLLTFGGPLTIPNQSIGIATDASGFNPLDGILGIGPIALTTNTVQGQSTVPTVTDNLASLGIIPASVVSVSFAPTNATFDINGELVFGGIDDSAFIGNLSVFPVTTTFPASLFFGVDATFVQGPNTILSSAGIVDTGTTLILLTQSAFSAYVAGAGAVPDPTTGLLSVTPTQFAALPTLDVVIGGVTFPLIPDAQRWPQQLNTAIGGSPDLVYLIVGNLGSGSGLDFILGQFFLESLTISAERFYSAFDSSGFVGLAQTAFTGAVVNN
ncbi:aspartic protease [Exidia glandulosa HHB12029]|uniref:Aspartic protease n=1 Tax=Exidia glandulosa HHB12029 TaxID=1314781 RepID=A0A165L4F5_EXIGL|nr:aspartic protease [Exidia glandulosa HHB12029]